MSSKMLSLSPAAIKSGVVLVQLQHMGSSSSSSSTLLHRLSQQSYLLLRHSISVSGFRPPPPSRHPLSSSSSSSYTRHHLLTLTTTSSSLQFSPNLFVAVGVADRRRHFSTAVALLSSSLSPSIVARRRHPYFCCCCTPSTSPTPMGSISQLSSVQQQRCAMYTTEAPSVAPAAPLTLEPLTGADAGILVARMSVPSTRNAFSRALAQAFRDMVDQLRYGLETRALILTSSVPQAFCSGVDLKERRKMTSSEVYTFVDGLRRTITDLSELPFPTIACIDGCALGGGLELALACDMRIATPRSELGLPETRLAIIPGCGGTQRLPRVVGVAKAKELILTGKRIGGAEAAHIGLLNHLTDDPFTKAIEIARDVLKTGPLANRVAKLAVEQGFDLELRSGLVVEQQCYAQLMPTKDRLEALDAFAQKRPPKFKGE